MRWWVGVIVGALIGGAGCEWPEDPQPYTSVVQGPSVDGEPPETWSLACTDEGFTVVAGSEPGCVSLEGIHGGGRFTNAAFVGDPPDDAVPLRVVAIGARAVDVLITLSCRPFYNDRRNTALMPFSDRCATAFDPRVGDCAFAPTFEDTLAPGSSLEFLFVGDGAEATIDVCTRPGP